MKGRSQHCNSISKTQLACNLENIPVSCSMPSESTRMRAEASAFDSSGEERGDSLTSIPLSAPRQRNKMTRLGLHIGSTFDHVFGDLAFYERMGKDSPARGRGNVSHRTCVAGRRGVRLRTARGVSADLHLSGIFQSLRAARGASRSERCTRVAAWVETGKSLIPPKPLLLSIF